MKLSRKYCEQVGPPRHFFVKCLYFFLDILYCATLNIFYGHNLKFMSPSLHASEWQNSSRGLLRVRHAGGRVAPTVIVAL